jgi:hypothetical protein
MIQKITTIDHPQQQAILADCYRTPANDLIGSLTYFKAVSAYGYG